MGRKRKQEGGGSAVPSTSKSSKLVVVSSAATASSASTLATQGGSGGGSRPAVQIAQSSDSGQGFAGQLHPFMNPVVLSNLFSLCPPGLLANCRLVCKTWRNHSLPAWRSSAAPKFAYHEMNTGKGVFVVAGENPRKRSATPLLEFLNFWERECSTLPFRNFYFANWEFGMRKEAKHTRSQRQVEQLFQLMGSQARKLTLASCKFPDDGEFRRVIYQSFPNLQTLILLDFRLPMYRMKPLKNDPASLEPVYGEQIHLKSISLRYFHCPMSMPVSWLELLTHFPSLTSVNLSSSPRARKSLYFLDFIRSLHEALSMIPKRVGSKLPKICLGTECTLELSQELLDLLRQLSVPLTSIRVNLSCDMNLVEALLTSHGETLTKIEVFKDARPWRWWATSTLQFPLGVKLNHLQELTISEVLCQNMAFLKYTPNLRKLRIVNMVGDGCGELAPMDTGLVSRTADLEDMKLPTLNNLYYGYKLNRVDLNRLFNWFPNLEVLTAFLDDELFPLVCENWLNLKHLHILGEEMTDEGVTGMGGTGQSEIEAGAIRPNVTYLKALECFRMESSRSGLTDVSALHGLLKLPKLRHLEVALCGHRFGGKVRRALSRHIRRGRDACWLDEDLWIPRNGSRDSCPVFAWDAKSLGILI